MKKNRIYFHSLCAALTALLLISCSKGRDYREIIPADAFMVMSANPKSLAHKAQIGDFTKSPVYSQLEKLLNEDSDMTPENREYLLSIIAEPSKAGLSMDHDCFWFFTGKNIQAGDVNVGIVYKVKDRKAVDKFAEWVSANAAPLERVDADKLTIYTDRSKRNAVALAYDDNALITYVSAGKNPAEGVEALKALFMHKKEDSILSKAHFVPALDGSHDMSMFFSYSGIWPMVQQQMSMFGGMGSLDWLGKMSFVIPANFEKGRVVSDMKIYFDDAEAEKQYMEFATANVTFSDELLKYLPEGSMAVFGGGMNGAKTYELLQKIPMYSMVLAMAPQAKTIFDAIDGGVVMSFNTMSAGGKFPEATIMAKVKDPNMLESVRGLMAMGNIPNKDIAPGQYEGSINGIPYWFGVRNDLFYVTSDARALALMDDGGASMHDKYGHLFTGNYGGFIFDFTALHGMLERLIAEGVISARAGMALPYIKIFEDAYLTSNSWTEASGMVNMTDKEKNAADVLYHNMEQLMVMMINR